MVSLSCEKLHKQLQKQHTAPSLHFAAVNYDETG